MIADPGPCRRSFRRVRYEWRLDPRPSLEQIAAAGGRRAAGAGRGEHHRGLGRAAPASWSSGGTGSLGTCLHLSTRMTARHRRDVLGEIRDLLAAGQPVAVVSTQLIEAGVDVDFPVVYRAWAPADSLQQAAGARTATPGWPRAGW